MPSRRRPGASRKKVEAQRQRLRQRGLRPVQFWVADTRVPDFPEQAHLQSLAVAKSAHSEQDQVFVEAISDPTVP